MSALIANNHKVLVESGAGNASSFTDEDYIKAGALVTKFKKEVFESGLNIIHLLTEHTGIFSSNGEARRAIKGNSNSSG